MNRLKMSSNRRNITSLPSSIGSVGASVRTHEPDVADDKRSLAMSMHIAVPSSVGSAVTSVQTYAPFVAYDKQLANQLAIDRLKMSSNQSIIASLPSSMESTGILVRTHEPNVNVAYDKHMAMDRLKMSSHRSNSTGLYEPNAADDKRSLAMAVPSSLGSVGTSVRTYEPNVADDKRSLAMDILKMPSNRSNSTSLPSSIERTGISVRTDDKRSLAVSELFAMAGLLQMQQKQDSPHVEERRDDPSNDSELEKLDKTNRGGAGTSPFGSNGKGDSVAENAREIGKSSGQPPQHESVAPKIAEEAAGATHPARGTTLYPKIREEDILLGQSPEFRNHPGNIRFRELIKCHYNEYESYGYKDRKNKTLLSEKVFQIMTRDGSRFLKQKDGQWKAEAKKDALKKVGSSFRDYRKHKLKRRGLSSGGHHVLLPKP